MSDDPPPLVSVVTPTWHRHEVLLTRCIPSVQAQVCHGGIEHIIVSDGPDPGLGEKLAGTGVRYAELPAHLGDWGGPGRRYGCELAQGQFIAYLDDDDAYRPQHVGDLVWALQVSGAGFAYSQMMVHMPSGARLHFTGPPGVMMGTPMIMHRRELLDIATWGDGLHEDTALVQAWLDAGVSHHAVTITTVDVFPGPATTAAINENIGAVGWE